MPTILVIWLAKLSAWLSQRISGGDASALPGLVAERLQPNTLKWLGRQLQGDVVLVTGTNGKTTTTHMIAAALETDHPLMVNRAGSNLTRGLISTMIAGSDWRGRLKYRQAVFEVDEAAFPAAFAALRPKAVVILNLFRDQLDRYGELNTLAMKLKAAIADTKACVILNADDPLVAWLGQGLANVSYFGLKSASVKKLAHDFAADSIACPICEAPLNYSQTFYAHIGAYTCERKNFTRPKLNVVAITTKVSLSASTSEIADGHKKASLNLLLPGLYNVYNGLAAITLATSLGRSLNESIERIEAMPPAYGRAETIKIDGRNLQLFLVKNPAGFNQVIQAYLLEKSRKPMLILVNDLIADGRDVSWLWDVAFEDLSKQETIMASGTRSYDLGLRLKYADRSAIVIEKSDHAINQFIESIPKGQSGIILPTYTAMLQLRRQLATSINIAGVNE